MLMAKRAQKIASLHGVQKAEPISCEAAVSIQCKDNGYLVTLSDGQKMQLAARAPMHEYSGARRLQGTQSRIGSSRRDPKEAGNGHKEDDAKPVPVLVEGKAIDLLQLWSEVAKHGGYEKATDSSAWSLISNMLGFGLNRGATLKLVYANYLRSFENKKRLFKNGVRQNLECWVAKNGKESPIGIAGWDPAASGGRDLSDTYQENNSETPSKRRRLNHLKEDSASSSYAELKVPILTGNSPGSSFVGLLEWLRRLALSPGDPRKGQGPRGSKQNEAWVQECETLIMRARSILWGRKELIYYGGSTSSMATQKIPPAIYYRELSKPNTRTLEKLRANQTRAMKCGLHLSSDATELRPAWLYQTSGQMFGPGGVEFGLNLSTEYVKSMNEALNIGYLLSNNAMRKRIPIGVHFQAQVPAWTGEVREEGSSSAEQSGREYFGGVRVWPLSDNRTASDFGKLGKGRPPRCSCAKPMSIECVRLHVAEKRDRLKKALGKVFLHWGFDNMGESVSARWTDKEEFAFNSTVRMNPYSMEKNFWDDLPTALPLKTMKELVSYYFNVFVVRRRAIENRVMPESVDSDDDERELLASESFGVFGKNVRGQFGSRVELIPNSSLFRSPRPG